MIGKLKIAILFISILASFCLSSVFSAETPEGKVAFIEDGRNLCLINPDGSGYEVLKKHFPGAEIAGWVPPAWSHDGSQIAWIEVVRNKKIRGGIWMLQCININTKKIVELTRGKFGIEWDGGPRKLFWRPDDKGISWYDSSDIYYLDIKNKGITKIITKNNVFDGKWRYSWFDEDLAWLSSDKLVFAVSMTDKENKKKYAIAEADILSKKIDYLFVADEQYSCPVLFPGQGLFYFCQARVDRWRKRRH